MIDRFEIIGHDSPRPSAERIIFCDGTGGSLYRRETDLELSHWRPNLTPSEYRAGTSTEICFRFLDRPRPGNWTAAVNNHVDLDGILSVYVLVHSATALQHRRTLIEAAEMGDFWGWGEAPAQRVFQGVARLMERSEGRREIYDEAFRRIPKLIDGTDPEVSEIEESLIPLRTGVQLVENGKIRRSLINERLALYEIPFAVAGDDDARAAYSPEFNELVSSKGILWPQVRAKWDRERVCLVSTERCHGWYHDLYFPGYLWADTEGLWQVPGMDFHDGMTSYCLENSRLVAAIQELQNRETELGYWCLGGIELPLGPEMQSRFPLVGRFIAAEKPGGSLLPPELVAKIIAKAI